jgi:hypothetical protein
MPQYDEDTRDKIVLLRGMRRLGTPIEPYEIVRISWGDDEADQVNYAVLQTDRVASVPPPFPVECRLVPDSSPNWFLPMVLSGTIGDEAVDLKFQDFDGVIADLLVEHGEGCKVEFFYWFPQVELLLTVWHGHLRLEDEADGYFTMVKAEQGFRAAESDLPRRQHYDYCQAIFGGLLETQAEIDEHGCPYNLHIGGPIGTNDPATGLPWTFCPRRDTGDCEDRGVNPLRHLSHRTIAVTVVNNQTHGSNLQATSAGNESSLKEPVRVQMGIRRCYDFKVMNYRRLLNNNNPDHGWFLASYEIGEGPINQISHVMVGGKYINAQNHYTYRRGEYGQTVPQIDPGTAPLTTHGYSGTAFLVYNFGWVNPENVDPNSMKASAVIDGLRDIRMYEVDEEGPEGTYTYTEGSTQNRVWQIMRMLADKRWGVGYDYDDFDIASWIAAAEWADQSVIFTDPDGNEWLHRRAMSDIDLAGKKLQQQIDDMCRSGRLSRPFLFDGKIHIVPLRALTEQELLACPTFTDEGDDPNVLWEGGEDESRSTLRVSRQSAIDLPNRIETTFDDHLNLSLETSGTPVEDVDAQLAAGRVQGKKQRRVVTKNFPLMGVSNREQQVKMSWSFLDLGEFDTGGLANNCRVTFKTWIVDALDLHPHKVIQFPADHWMPQRYGFTHFRILPDGIERNDDLSYQITAQAYPIDYMETFERPSGIGGGGNDNAMVVASAGTTAMNGTWNRMGTSDNGYPWYQKDTYIAEVRWNAIAEVFQWRMHGTTYVGQTGVDAATYPWDEVWVTGTGSNPAPTVTEGSASPAPPEPDVATWTNDPLPFRPVIDDVEQTDGTLLITIGAGS